MKKSFALLIAFAMVFSVFAPAALAADAKTIEEKYAELEEAEIFVGMGDGSAALDEDMTRAQAAVIVSKLFGLNIDNVPANASFTDVPTKHWAYASVEAAQAAGIISGRGDGTFDPNGLVTKQELAIMFGIAYENILGVTIPNGTVNGEFKNWPGTEKYIAFAVNNGILENTSDFTAVASRAVLAYAAYQGHADTTVAEEVGIANVSASGVNKFTVVLSGKVDTDAAKFEVKRGSVKVDVEKTDWNTNGTTATLVLEQKLRNQVYTVTLSGIENLDADKATAEVTGQEERIADIEILAPSSDLPQSADVKIPFEAYNQYGEKVELRSGDIEVHVPSDYTGNVDAKNKQVKLDLTAGDFNQTIFVTLISKDGLAQANELFTIKDEPRVARVEIGNLLDEDGDVIDSVDAGETAYLEVIAKDQYGLDVTNEDILNSSTKVYTNNNDITIVGGNTPFDDANYDNGNDTPVVEISVAAEADRNATIFLIALGTGFTDQVDIHVGTPNIPVSFDIVEPTKTLAEGDEDVYLELVVENDEGKKLTAEEIADLASDLTIYSTRGVADLADDEATKIKNSIVIEKSNENYGKIKIDRLQREGNEVIYVQYDKNPLVRTQASFYVDEERIPAEVKLSNTSTIKLMHGANNAAATIQILDQYGELFDNTSEDYIVEFEIDESEEGLAEFIKVNDSGNAALSSIEDGEQADLEDVHDLKLNVKATSDKSKTGKVTVTVHLLEVERNGSGDITDEAEVDSVRKIFEVTDGKDEELSYSVNVNTKLFAVNQLKLKDTDGSDIQDADVVGSVYKLFTPEVKISAKDKNGNTVVLPGGAIQRVVSSDPSAVEVVKAGSKYHLVGKNKRAAANIHVYFETPEGESTASILVNVDNRATEAPEVDSITVAHTNGYITKAELLAGVSAWFDGDTDNVADNDDRHLFGAITVKDTYGNSYKMEKSNSNYNINAYVGASFYLTDIKYDNDSAGNKDLIIDPITGKIESESGSLKDIESFTINIVSTTGKTASVKVSVNNNITD